MSRTPNLRVVAALLAAGVAVFMALLGTKFIDTDVHRMRDSVKNALSQYNFDISQLSLSQWQVFDYVDNLFESSRRIFESKDFKVGAELAEQGYRPEFPVIMLPGIVSTGLESWSTAEEDASFFRQRLWGTGSMFRFLLLDKQRWMKHMKLDPVTGVDPEGVKVRAAEGLDAASYFAAGYWVWNRIIQNLAAVGYDMNMMSLASYDWRLSMYNLEARDQFFSRLQYMFERNLHIHGKKTVLLVHSMGGTVGYYFLKWIENRAGAAWIDKHIEALTLIAGTMLGVPKSMAALSTGEVRETVAVPQTLSHLFEIFINADERAPVFRSWAGSASMIPMGGETIWGNLTWAPDDRIGSNETLGSFFDYKHSAHERRMDITESIQWLSKHAPETYGKMLASNYSYGFERNPRQIARNNKDYTKWVNPLETSLPKTHNMKIYCIYGYGKPTERGYYMRDNPQANQTHLHSRIDTSVERIGGPYNISSGCKDGEGDGTVALLSLGSVCTGAWQQPRYNPGNVPVTVHEILHQPDALDLRGGEGTGDHVDILGSRFLNEAVVKIATGRGNEVHSHYVSPIREYSARINW